MAGELTGDPAPSAGPAARSVAIVPARWASTRLPGKPLADVAGTPLIVRVLQGLAGAGLDLVAAATDDERIAEEVRGRGFRAVMTSDCKNGTHRVHEAWKMLGEPGEFIINVQGDEPLVDDSWIRALFQSPPRRSEVTTLARRVSASDGASSHSVKVAVDGGGKALYFSRQVIPWGAGDILEHIGVYCFSPDSLRVCAGCSGTILSRTERLEQLAWMESGIGVRVVEGDFNGLGVDTPADLERAVSHFSRIP